MLISKIQDRVTKVCSVCPRVLKVCSFCSMAFGLPDLTLCPRIKSFCPIPLSGQGPNPGLDLDKILVLKSQERSAKACKIFASISGIWKS